MRITVPRESFLSAFQLAAQVAPQRSAKPILANVLLRVGPGSSTLLATDLEVGIQIEVADVEVDRPGSVALPAARVGAILRESTDAKLRIESTRNVTTIHGERSKFELPAIDADEFPAIKGFASERYVEIAASLLTELIRRTVFATDANSSRYALGGALFEIYADKLLAVATDGRRLARMEGSARFVGGEPDKAQAPIVPARALQLMERAFTDGALDLAFGHNEVLARGPAATIYSRLVEGRFPRWRDAIPERRNEHCIPLTVGPTLHAVRQAAIVVSDQSRGIDFTFGDGVMRIEAAAAEKGESRIELPVAYDGPKLAITLDYRFVLDFLKVFDSEDTFTLCLKDADSPALFLTNDVYVYVVMPLAREAETK